MPPSRVHFNGSVNLPDAETVMRQISERVPHGVQRMTDGETGDRSMWVEFLDQKFRTMPEFEPGEHWFGSGTDGREIAGSGSGPRLLDPPRLRLVEGVLPQNIEWSEPGYADAYRESFEVFRRLQDDGTIPSDMLFQLQYPTPLAPTARSIMPEYLPIVLPAYEQALFGDLDRVLAAIPHECCAVQWDLAVEIGLLAGAFGAHVSAPIREITAGVARCVGRVPDDVPVGLHLCYGDLRHKHFIEPETLGIQVQLLADVIDAVSRPINFVSFTVPQSRADEEYFRPLQTLQTGPETELYFALVPYYPADLPEGVTAEQVRLIDHALNASGVANRCWGICTECGMGRADAQDIPTLLDVHRKILETHGQQPGH
ncbi:hypothetical protein [Mycobacterium montefiorense]|uniref:Uncharacterized protein n=1 Tax=Mycobacterium montefiorense TaxID=154654 RepID=A0AA37UME0_9MYCO|nr:hypothetical protein [Mycobacterium montefiorense]GBG38411.1 hypothetical protein MmonteBS_27830 [Mycobacterium montefiorense]GKU34240.1 hypothetical protein NJB14191_15860 [Mycobacterium montefiorense]GKU38859.1 hypothetical protein NJB14192_08550 [Mycobacterium montefiorense]GKU48105.1 hypothetical protein NJB14194_47210 [Mycobacterium montefiorense]GKU49622.1 hypothetical protein NJB14195_08690 [Mycobacterium montefiorense]